MTEADRARPRGIVEGSRNLDLIRSKLMLIPFVPDPVFKNPEVQTELGFKSRLKDGEGMDSERKIVDVGGGDRVAVDLSLQDDSQNSPTILIIPSLIGSSRSPDVFRLGIAGFKNGFNIAAMNLRGQGNTENLSQKLYHAGLSEDLLTVIQSLVNEGLDEIFIAGFSLGGNVSLKAVGEDSGDVRKYVKGLAVVSSAVDLAFNSEIIERSPHKNLILSALKIAALKMGKAYPEAGWGTKEEIRRITSIKDWDEKYMTGPKPKRWGFTSAQNYYERASALPYVSNIRIPTLAIHSKDDSIASVEPLLGLEFSGNQNIINLITENGGHLGFISEEDAVSGGDKYWAKNRVIQFFTALRQMDAA